MNDDFPFEVPANASRDQTRATERASIRTFLERAAVAGYFSGKVLDFGCGKQPYRELVEASGGEYTGVDPRLVEGQRADVVLAPFDTVLCTQVFQYLPRPAEQLAYFHEWLEPDGRLVLTYPTNWEELEADDTFRFTRHGMDRLVKAAGFGIDVHEERLFVEAAGLRLTLGYGLLATAL